MNYKYSNCDVCSEKNPQIGVQAYYCEYCRKCYNKILCPEAKQLEKQYKRHVLWIFFFILLSVFLRAELDRFISCEYQEYLKSLSVLFLFTTIGYFVHVTSKFQKLFF